MAGPYLAPYNAGQEGLRKAVGCKHKVAAQEGMLVGPTYYKAVVQERRKPVVEKQLLPEALQFCNVVYLCCRTNKIKLYTFRILFALHCNRAITNQDNLLQVKAGPL